MVLGAALAAAVTAAAASLAALAARRKRRAAAAKRELPNAQSWLTATESAANLLQSFSFVEGAARAATRQWSFYTAGSASFFADPVDTLGLGPSVATLQELEAVADIRAILRQEVDLASEAWVARWLEDLEVLRYVRARFPRVDEAKDQLRTAIGWRRNRAAEWEGVSLEETGSFGPAHLRYLGVMREARTAAITGPSPGIAGALPDWWSFLYARLHMDIYGADRLGVPVTYNNFGNSDLQGCLREVGLDRLRQFVVYMNDHFFDIVRAAARKCSPASGGAVLHGGIVIADAEGLSWRHRDEMRVFQQIAQVASFLHPERQRRCFIVRAPRLFSAMWRMVSPTLDPRARDKVTIIAAGEPLDALIDEVGIENVPRCLGGEFPDIPPRPKSLVPRGAFAEHKLGLRR